MIEQWMVDELQAQLEDHDKVVILNEATDREITVTNVQYDGENDRVVIYVSA